MVTLISTQGQALYAIHKDSESRNTQSVQFLCHDWFVFQNQEWDIKKDVLLGFWSRHLVIDLRMFETKACFNA